MIVKLKGTIEKLRERLAKTKGNNWQKLKGTIGKLKGTIGKN